MDIERFVQNVKFYCNLVGIKPTTACRESGAGERLLENLKRGSIPSVEKVQQLAQHLGVTVSELLGEPLPADGLTPKERALLTAYRQADQRARDMVEVALAPFSAKEKTTTAG